MPEALYGRKHGDDERNEPARVRRGRLMVDVSWAYVALLALQTLLLLAILVTLWAGLGG